jgi:hypothetical protein
VTQASRSDYRRACGTRLLNLPSNPTLCIGLISGVPAARFLHPRKAEAVNVNCSRKLSFSNPFGYNYSNL